MSGEHAEETDAIDDLLAVAPGGLIAYDRDCAICRRAVRWCRFLERRGYAFVALQDAVVAGRLGLAAGDLPDEFKLIRAGRPVLGGAAAIHAILATLPGAWWLRLLLALPGAATVLDRWYRWVARNRRCLLTAPPRPRA